MRREEEKAQKEKTRKEQMELRAKKLEEDKLFRRYGCLCFFCMGTYVYYGTPQ